MTELTWLIPLMPLAAYAVLLSSGKRVSEVAASGLSVLALSLATLFSLLVFVHVATVGPLLANLVPWLPFGAGELTVGVRVTALNAAMLLMVSIVSTFVFLFARGYMRGDDRFSRFYQYLNLFVFAMLGLVVSPNLLQFYIMWELVGVCSYLLVGFWYFKPEAAAAAKKAFVVTRIGDVGLFIAMILLYLHTGTFDFHLMFARIAHAAVVSPIITVAALLTFVGAIGKSAQFPLHVWLPDAMEGPTPVSALIHAATMVAAGVYLVARMYPVFEAAPVALETVAIIGGITALLAASIGLTQRDIKRVIAYSTMSQLGYMMLGLGVGAYTAGIFHLLTHAFFKALLFLAAGSVIHALGTQDLYEMGGLRKMMPITHLAFLAGALALAGIPPFAGFWSKDDILTAAFSSGQYLLYAMGLLGVFFTAFYIFRVYFLTFGGQPRGREQAQVSAHGGVHGEDGANVGVHAADGTAHAHGGGREGGLSMTVPMIVLALFATFGGIMNTPFAPYLTQFLQDRGPIGANPPANVGLMAVSAAVALAGIGLAYYVYGQAGRAERLAKGFGFLYRLSYRKFYVDELYALAIVAPAFALAEALRFVDRWMIDGVVRVLGELGYSGGVGLKYSNTGQVQTYGLVALFGILILAVAALRVGGVW